MWIIHFHACGHFCLCLWTISPHSHGLQSTHQWQWALVGTGPVSSSGSPFPGPPHCSFWPPLGPHPGEHCTAPSHGSSLHTKTNTHRCVSNPNALVTQIINVDLEVKLRHVFSFLYFTKKLSRQDGFRQHSLHNSHKITIHQIETLLTEIDNTKAVYALGFNPVHIVLYWNLFHVVL